MSDEDRSRKSWRDIDKQRDGSMHRKDDRGLGGPGGKRGGPRSQKSYRAALDRLFESGKIADLVEQKAPGETADDAGSESRLKKLARIKKATGRDEITKEVDAYLKESELPEDLEILGQVLEHRNPTRQLEAMEGIDRLLDRERPKRYRAMVGQLKMIRDMGDDREMVQLANRLIDRLEKTS